MKGYVRVVFTDEEVSKIIDLARDVILYNDLDKEDQFSWTIKESKFLFWTCEYKIIAANVPDKISPFFCHYDYAQGYHYCELSPLGKNLVALYKLVRNSHKIYLDEDLCGAVNSLRNRGYI